MCIQCVPKPRQHSNSEHETLNTNKHGLVAQVLGYTALHTAADHDHMDSVKLLVERQADVNLQRLVTFWV